MDKLTKAAAFVTAALALLGIAAIIWMAAVGQSLRLADATRHGVEGVGEVTMSLIALVWMAWGWRRTPRKAQEIAWGERPVQKMETRTKISIGTTTGLVVTTIAVLCLYGNGEDIGPEQIRLFTKSVLYGAIGSIALTWAVWHWVGKRR